MGVFIDGFNAGEDVTTEVTEQTILIDEILAALEEKTTS